MKVDVRIMFRARILFEQIKKKSLVKPKFFDTYQNEEGIVLLPSWANCFEDYDMYIKFKKDNTFSVKIWQDVSLRPKDLRRYEPSYPFSIDWRTLHFPSALYDFNYYRNSATYENRYATTCAGMLVVIKTFTNAGFSVKWSNQTEEQAAAHWNTIRVNE